MKQTFTLEIDSSDYVEPVSTTYLMAMLRIGFNEARMSNLSILDIKETTVEQSVEPFQDQEFSQKPLALSGMEDGEDYLEDRFNDLLER